MPRFDLPVLLPVIIVAVLCLLLALVTAALRARKRSGKARRAKEVRRDFGYCRQPCLLTDAERSFFGVLLSITSPWFHIAPKVRLYDLVEPQKGLTASARQTAVNLISSRHCDFVLCHADTMLPAIVIELDDASHAEPKRGIKDAELDHALHTAGLPLLRIRCAAAYSPQDLTDKIRHALHQK